MSAAATAAAQPRKGGPDAQPWTGPTRRYDIVKEFVIALVVVTLLTVVLAWVFSSPDDPQVTIRQWAQSAPKDFVATAATELDGTSGTATYGAPYTHDPSAAQQLGPITPQNWPGVRIPINTVQDFVVRPLELSATNPAIRRGLRAWNRATPAQQQRWASAYAAAAAKAPNAHPLLVRRGAYGPVPVMMRNLLTLARTGGLDGILLSQGHFYQTDYTRPLLFLADGGYLESLARAQHLGGDQWGMMNETGNYPGQAWLWLYTFWYQVKPFSTSPNADALVWGLMMLLTLALVLLPFIPGVRSLPKLLRVYRLIWRDYYRTVETPSGGAPAGTDKPS